jgi:RNA polymerase sigma-32 factor
MQAMTNREALPVCHSSASDLTKSGQSFVSLPPPTDFPAYTRAVAALPALSQADETCYLKAWNDHKDVAAARALVLSNLHLVVKVVRNHQGYGVSLGDLAQEGTIGLMKAVHKFDASKRVRLATYAWYWIEAEVREFIMKNRRLISWGTSALAKKMFFGYRKTVAALKDLGEERDVPTAAAVAEALGISSADAEMARQYFMGAEVSLWDEHTDEHDYESPGAGHGLVALNDRHAESAADRPDEAAELDQRAAMVVQIHQALPLLSPRHRRALEARHLTDRPEALSVLAKEWSVSVERVRQIEKAAVAALKTILVDASAPVRISGQPTAV